MKKKSTVKNSPVKKSTNGIVQTARHAASFLSCILVALALMYYVNGTFGILIAASLICAFAVSAIITVAAARFIRIEASLDKSSVSKGDTAQCVIRISKNVFLPTPVVELHIGCSPKLAKDIDICKISLVGNDENVVKIPLKAKFSGAAEVFISHAYLSDYLGIFRLKLKNIEASDGMTLSVYPNIPDVPVQTDFLKAAVFSASDDDEEETDETAAGFTGMPGYDHREYYPGDPIKRINWKLSSKRGIYMIRLDEMTAGSGQVFLLDSPKLPENEKSFFVRDVIIEGMLAVFRMLVMEGRDATLFFVRNKIWQRADIHNLADINELQELLSECDMYTPEHIVPEGIEGIGKTPICFTGATAEDPKSAAAIAANIPDVLMISALSADLPTVAAHSWIISDEFELKKQM